MKPQTKIFVLFRQIKNQTILEKITIFFACLQYFMWETLQVKKLNI